MELHDSVKDREQAMQAMRRMQESIKANQILQLRESTATKKRKATTLDDGTVQLNIGKYIIITTVALLAKRFENCDQYTLDEMDQGLLVGIRQELSKYLFGDIMWSANTESIKHYVHSMMISPYPYKMIFEETQEDDDDDRANRITEMVCLVLCERTEKVIHGCSVQDCSDKKEQYLRAFVDLYVRFKSGCVAIKDQMANLMQLFRQASPCKEEIPNTFDMFLNSNKFYLDVLNMAFAFQNLLVEASCTFYAQHEKRSRDKIDLLLLETGEELQKIIDERFFFDWQMPDDDSIQREIKRCQQKTIAIMKIRMQDWYNNERLARPSFKIIVSVS